MKSTNQLEEFVNMPELLDRVESDQELLAELFALFREDLPGICEALRTAVALGDVQEIERAAHRLKGMLANLSAKQAAAVAAEIESTARASNADRVPELMSALDSQISALSVALDSYMAST